MRFDDLDHRELLELSPDTGELRFAGRRALLLDAEAMGVLRKYLVDNFGVTATRAVLTQFGFAHGWRMAGALRAEYDWDTDEDWRRAGPRIHTLGGLFLVDAAKSNPLSDHGTVLLSSYEAEQHTLHFGRSDTPVCWTICGLISGYLSHTTGQEIYVLEDRCVCRGDAACRLVGRTRGDWGQERVEELRFFEQERLADVLDVSLRDVTETLRSVERKLRARQRELVTIVPDIEEPLGIVARSPAMQNVIDLTRRVARVDSTVVVTGESGCGKERIARLIHEESPRANEPFVAVNCAAVADTLLESELFGHVRGAFTGAEHDRQGLFEAANGGTLLLDEIGDVSAGMQVGLLRALQAREIRRVGETKSRPVNVRIVAATNRDLADAVQEGSFREDLYYRLNVVEVPVPPLRERRADVLPLARVFIAESSGRMGRAIVNLTPKAADLLLRYQWPGNVRELENAMERAVALARSSRVDVEDLPEAIRVPALETPYAGVRTLEAVEREHIVASLARNGGNQTITARQLEIGTATLYRKLKRYGMVADRIARKPPS